MIVGSGLVAKAFSPLFASASDITVFASGVSNSDETRLREFLREKDLLKRVLSAKPRHLVYFSTCSVSDADRFATPYVKHKIQMESLLSEAKRFTIFRLPQVVGHTLNQHTLTNYLFTQITTRSHIVIWRNAWRNIIDIDDIVKLATVMLRDDSYSNSIINIANPNSVSVIALVEIFEAVLGMRANYSLVDRGVHYAIDASVSVQLAPVVGIEFGDDYIKKVVEKYYGT